MQYYPNPRDCEVACFRNHGHLTTAMLFFVNRTNTNLELKEYLSYDDWVMVCDIPRGYMYNVRGSHPLYIQIARRVIAGRFPAERKVEAIRLIEDEVCETAFIDMIVAVNAYTEHTADCELQTFFEINRKNKFYPANHVSL